MEGRYRFTVATATHNRSRLLKRTFASIDAQSFRDFEWVIVDDGSTDDTEVVAREIIDTADFPVRYIKQRNGGKHTATNNAVAQAAGELFVMIDDDDELKPDALEIFDTHWNRLKGLGLHESYCCVTALCEDHNGRLVGDKFPRDGMTCSYIEFRAVHQVRGEKFGCQRVDVMREFPFPQLDRGTIKTGNPSTYVSESLVWLPMTRKYKTLFINEILRVYHMDDTSMATGTQRPWRSSASHVAGNSLILNEYHQHIGQNPKYYLKLAAAGARYSFHLGRSPFQILASIKPFVSKALMLFGMPVGYLRFRLDLSLDARLGRQQIATQDSEARREMATH